MSHKPKHIPQRMCIVCRTKYEKSRLTRFVQTESGVVIDPSGKRNGRGAYVCDTLACLHSAASTDVLAKALRAMLTEADRQRIRELAS